MLPAGKVPCGREFALMRCVVQRVTRASVTINGSERREIGLGLVILLGIHGTDTKADVAYMAQKVAGLRIFSDEAGKMNLSVSDLAQGSCLVISQFTLYGDARKGKRPSFIEAAHPAVAIPLYENFASQLRELWTERRNRRVRRRHAGGDFERRPGDDTFGQSKAVLK